MWFQWDRQTPTRSPQGLTPPLGASPMPVSPPPTMIRGMESPPCTWPVDMACLPEDPDDAVLRHSVDTAVGVLWALTGRRFGVCPVEARPCPAETPGILGIGLTPGPGWGLTGPGWWPVLDSGVVRNVPTCTTARCDRTSAVLLPGPVHRLLGFVVDGEDIALDALTLDGDRVYRRGRRAWPEQDLTSASGEKGTWSIRYLRGVQPPAGAARMVGLLAKEFYNACTGGRCELPRRTTQVQRQGVTVHMVEPSEIYATGATGLSEVDLWIRAHNPYGLSQQSSVWSPDLGVW